MGSLSDPTVEVRLLGQLQSSGPEAGKATLIKLFTLTGSSCWQGCLCSTGRASRPFYKPAHVSTRFRVESLCNPMWEFYSKKSLWLLMYRVCKSQQCVNIHNTEQSLLFFANFSVNISPVLWPGFCLREADFLSLTIFISSCSKLSFWLPWNNFKFMWWQHAPLLTSWTCCRPA